MTMYDSDVPVKTEKGLAEMKIRSLGLPQRIRTALLLVDGVRTTGEIRGLLAASGDGRAALQTLLDADLIRIQAVEAKAAEEAVTALDAAPGPEKEATQSEQEPAARPASGGKRRRDAVTEEKGRIKIRVRTDSDLNAGIAASSRLKTKTRINGPDTRLRAQTRVRRKTESDTRIRGHGAASMPAVSGTSRPELQPELQPKPQLNPQPEKPPAVSGATQQPRLAQAPLPVPQQAPSPFPPAPSDMSLVVARAYLANELDNHLGIHGYLLKLKVMDCVSRAELEELFDSIKKDLTDAFYIDAIDVIRHAQSILDR
jgi:hypothetical protein